MSRGADHARTRRPPAGERAGQRRPGRRRVPNADEAPNASSFRRKVGGAWRDVTAAQFLAEVIEVAKGLVAAGVEPGDRVGILSANCYEWTLFDFAIWAAGAASVPIYVTSSAEQIEWILSDSGAVAVVAENAALAERVDEVRDKLTGLKHVWRIDDKAVETLVEAGKDVADEVRRRSAQEAVRPDDLATLIYTSGTTGKPKGVALTHRNLYAACRNAVEYLAGAVQGRRQEALDAAVPAARARVRPHGRGRARSWPARRSATGRT